MSFEKIQIRVSLNNIDQLKQISLLNIEIGYKNSSNQIVWKSNARVCVHEKIVDTMEQATWKNFDNNNKIYVFDFLESTSREIIIKQTTINSKDNSMNIIENKVDITIKTTSFEYFTVNILQTNI